MANPKVFSVLDSSTGIFGQPFLQVNRLQAMRSFSDLSKQEGQVMCQHPTDFCLMELGSFDDLTGQFVGLVAPQVVMTAVEGKEVK